MLAFIVSWLLIGAVECQYNACPDGWVSFRGSCYLFNDETQLDWVEATHACALHHSTLVSVESSAEDIFIKGFLKRLFRCGTVGINFWTGGSDSVSEGLWTWYADDSSFTFTDWAPNEPNDSAHHEDCLEFSGGYGLLWNDRICTTKQYFICEKRMDDNLEVVG